jgi:addiction module HigA family antidote
MSIERTGSPNWTVHPGEILKEEFMEPLRMSSYRLAKELDVPTPRIHDIVIQKRGITVETAVLLARFFGTSDLFWLNLQDAYEINQTKHRLADKLKHIKPMTAAASR